jgi:2-dehydro-3-deoxygluconokinase
MMERSLLCFGELLLRLGAPGRQMLLQSPQLEVFVGGAEANVAVSMARFGHRVSMLSVVPDNPLGEAASGELRRYRVNTDLVQLGAGRMGLYFLVPGAIHRPSAVLYDRADSAFALASARAYDWDRALQGVTDAHFSGVTPALNAECATACRQGMEMARQRGLQVSFDGNYRAKLWESWKGDAASITRVLMSGADLLFADYRDIGIALNWTPPNASADDRIVAAAQAAFTAFPQLQTLATTIRVQHSVDHHALSAVLVSRKGGVQRTPSYEITPIVDRIGGGDAFAAGVLHGRFSGMSDADSLHFGLGAACLKHSIPGDCNLVGVDDVLALIEQGRFDVRR